MTVHISLADFVEPSFYNEIKEQLMDSTSPNPNRGSSIFEESDNRTYNPQEPATPQPPIEMHTTMLGNRLSDLREEIQSLAIRLDHALTPEEPSVHDSDGGSKRQMQSTLAHTLQDFTETIHHFTLMINELKRRVEI